MLSAVKICCKTMTSANGCGWQSVLDYWLDPKATFHENMKKWFMGGPEQDKEIKEKFGHLVEKARNGDLKSWEDNPKGSVAHIILLDQFCRSIYRGTPEAFSHDAVAIGIANSFLPGGKYDHKKMNILERVFLYIPFEHSENMQDQETSVKLLTELAEEMKGTEHEQLTKAGVMHGGQHRELVLTPEDDLHIMSSNQNQVASRNLKSISQETQTWFHSP